MKIQFPPLRGPGSPPRPLPLARPAILFLALGCLGCLALRSRNFSFEEEAVSARMKADVEYLASDELGGRPPGPFLYETAGKYIRSQWKEAGLKSRKLDFVVQLAGDSLLPCSNLIAFLDTGADSTILVSAHYDHLGTGGAQSLEIRRQGIHPGADDNASGVAVMLELARFLSAQKTHHSNYLFAALSAHEIGLHGSRNLEASPYLRPFRIRLCLNLDMVGRLNRTSNTLRMDYCPRFPHLARYAGLGAAAGLNIRPTNQNETLNDFSVFCAAGHPAINLSTGVHEDYHRMSDLPARINYEGMLKVLRLCRLILTPPAG